MSRGDAIKLYLEIAGVNGVATPNKAKLSSGFDWPSCVEAFTETDLQRLADWRGYSPEFCSWLKQCGLIGLYEGRFACPVHNDVDAVVAAHYREKNGSWRYYPHGAKARSLIIGDLKTAINVHVFESPWDAFSACDKLGIHERESSAVIITRGAGNGSAVRGFILATATVFAWKQNDELKNGKYAGDEWLKAVCENAGATVKWARTPEQFKDLNEWTKAGAQHDDLISALVIAEVVFQPEKSRPLIEFKTPSQLKSFVPPPGMVLVGDCHIVRGSVFVIGGAPGVGKSRSAVALAEAGATGNDWFGLTIHRQFKTMIIQNENGPFRLSKEFGELDCDALEDFVRVCPPPPFGMCFSRDDFRGQLSAAISEFMPAVIFLDPWNAATRDDKAREYLETFDLVRSVLPNGDDSPALGIVAHTRKPGADERTTGRGLLSLLAGSYVLGSVPRSVFVMQGATDDPQDNRVVWTCCKNNDGELGARSAWERRNGLFAPVQDFEWETFDDPKDARVSITAEDLAEIFENGKKQLKKAEAEKALEALTGAKRTACYNALALNGRFASALSEAGGMLSWKA